jgi:hypothetical protein
MSELRTLHRFTTLAIALALSACNSSAPPPVASAPAQATTNVTPSSFHLPEGAGCTGDIARWQAIQQNDLQMGHVNKAIYDQIQGEIANASTACQANRSAEASALVRASKARHGYPG